MNTDDVAKALEQMGGNAYEVAATLRASGVQGVKNSVRVLNPSFDMSRTFSASTASMRT
jgi:hypothetical protein